MRAVLAGDGSVTDIAPTMHAHPTQLIDPRIGQRLRAYYRLAKSYHAQNTTTLVNDPPCVQSRSPMKDLRARDSRVQTLNRIPLGKGTGISARGEYDAQGCPGIKFETKSSALTGQERQTGGGDRPAPEAP